MPAFRDFRLAFYAYRLCLLLLTAVFLFAPGRASAQGFTIVRDTEIENTIRLYMAPVFRAAGIDISTVHIYLVKDQSLNAFVAGGMNIFIHTGLLTAADNPRQVIGVLAHETGHITGGHLSRIREGLRNATTQMIIASVLGAAAAAASGNPQGIGAALLGGSEVGQRSLLSYTRGMEQSADQAGVKFLDESHQSSRGMLEFMKKLQAQEGGVGVSGDPYLRSHPLTADRIRFIQNHVASSPYSDKPTPPDLIAAHARMRGKLNGFIDPPQRTLQHYSADDPSMEAKYARSIALMRLSEKKKALAIINPLIAATPKDPFLHELRGDILRDAGRNREAAEAYKKAVAILPWAALIRISLAQSQLELNDNSVLTEVTANLREALRYEPRNAGAWRQLAIAYGRDDRHGLVSHALAEEAVLKGDYATADRLATRAMKVLPKGSPEWLRSQDIEFEAKRAKEQRG